MKASIRSPKATQKTSETQPCLSSVEMRGEAERIWELKVGSRKKANSFANIHVNLHAAGA